MIELIVATILAMQSKLDLTIVLDEKERSWSSIFQNQWDSPAWNEHSTFRQDIEDRYRVKFVHRVDEPCRCREYPAFIVGHQEPIYRKSGTILPDIHEQLMREVAEHDRVQNHVVDSNGGWQWGTWNDDGTPIDTHHEAAIEIEVEPPQIAVKP